MMGKKLEGKGEVDYDYKHDILFFKTKDRQYSKSIELLDNIVIDVDKLGFLVGIQIFDASEFLNLDKKELLSIPKWVFNANVYDGNKIEIRLTFQIKVRNKIVEKNPKLFETIAKEIEQKTKAGMDKNLAAVSVMRAHLKELQGLMQ